MLKSFCPRFLVPTKRGYRPPGPQLGCWLLLCAFFFAQNGHAKPKVLAAEEVEARVHQASGIAFPLHLGGLTLSDVSDFETQSPGMGFGYKYQGAGATQGMQAIIYVYNLRVKDVPTRLQSPMLAQIRQLTRREISQQAEMQSLIARPVFGNTLRMDSEQGPVEALFDGFFLEIPSSSGPAGPPLAGYHFAALWTAKNHFIKLKVLRDSQSSASPEMMGAFIKAALVQSHGHAGVPQR